MMVARPTTPVCITTTLGSRTAASSSPTLPSLSQILSQRNVALTSNIQASPLPNTASLGFISAADLLRTSKSSDQSAVSSTNGDINHTDKSARAEIKEACSKREKYRGDLQQDVQSEKLKVQITKSGGRSARANSKVNVTNVLDKHSVADNRVYTTGKAREKKCADKDQSRIKKPKITKPGAGDRALKPPKRPIKEKKSKSRNDLQDAQLKADGHVTITSIECDDGWGLEEALKRRKDWTPVKDTAPKEFEFKDAGTAWSSLILTSGSPKAEVSNVRSSNLLDSFGYPTSDQFTITKPLSTRTSDGEGLIKRRKIEPLQGITLPLPIAPLAKTKKSPKKKPRTITNRAIASFVSEDEPNPSTLLDYLIPSADNPDKEEDHGKLLEQGLGSSEMIIAKSPVRKPVKRKVSKIKAKKEAVPSISLLSPNSALKDVNSQDVLFGTSSQLAREESPTFIKDLQKALSASELFESPKCEQKLNDTQTSVVSNRSSFLSARDPALSSRLWGVAARDLEGSLLNAEVVNLADPSPQFRRYVSSVASPKSSATEQCTLLPVSVVADGESKSIDVVPASEAPNPQQLSKTSESAEIEPETSIPRSVAEASLRDRPKSKSPVKKRKASVASKALANMSASLEMPNYNGYMDNDLAQAVAAWGFRSVRGRKARISLLERCWKENRDRKILQSLPPNIQASSVPAEGSSKEASKPCSSTKKQGKAPKARALVVTSETKTGEPEKNSLPKKRRGRPRKSLASDTPGSESKFWKTPKLASDEIALPTPVEDVSDAFALPSTPSPPRNGLSSKPPVPLPFIIDLPQSNTSRDAPTLYSKITEAVRRCPPTHDAQNLTFYERILMYEPIVLEDLTIWLNEGALDKVGCDDEIDPLLVKQWCESQSICCVWRENLRGGERVRW